MEINNAKRVNDQIICNNSTELTSKAMFLWSKESLVALGFIQPDQPKQNVFVETVNSNFPIVASV